MPKAPSSEARLTSSGALERARGFNRRIFRATAALMAISALVLVASTAKELAVANYFGRSDALDAFLIAYVLPAFVVNIVAGSFNSAVIPTYIEVRETEGREAAQRLFSGAITWSLGLLAAVSVLLAALAPYYLPFLGSRFSASKLLLTRHLLYVLLPLVVLSALTVNWTAVLNAGEKFTLPAMLPALTPLTALGFLVALGKTWGIYALAVGTVVGTLLQAGGLAWTARAHGVRLAPHWYGLDARLRQVIGQYAPMVAGALLMGTTDLVDLSMAAMLERGSVAALNYARKIVSVLLVVGATPLGTVSLPYFSEMVAKADWGSCRHTLRTYGGLIALVTVPLTAGLVVFARPLVHVVFERGAFTAHDTAVVSRVEALLALQIPFYVLASMGVRVVSALKRNALLMTFAAASAVLNVVLNLVLMRRYGVAGIALSTSIVYLVSCSLIFGSLYLLIGRKVAGSPARKGL